MKSITFTCRVITPLFMGGADQLAELRTQTFKGMIRFWWRALKAENDLKKLKEEEVKIFGGTEDGIASNVKIVIQKDKIDFCSNLKDDFGLRFRFNPTSGKVEGDDVGINYLLYSTMLGRERNRQCIKPGSMFTVTLCSRNEEALKHTAAAFWCAIFLGGFGTRARRGAGNLTVVNCDNVYGLSFKPQDDIGKWLQDNVKKCFELVGGQPKVPCFRYSNLSICRVIVSNVSFSRWTDALNDIGKKFAEFRCNNKSKIFEAAAFGLPIRHSDKSFVNLIKKSDNTKMRRASPVIIKLIQVQNNFYWMILRFAGEFMPINEFNVQIDRSRKATSKITMELVDEFWNVLRKNNNKEIVLGISENIDCLKKN